VADREWREAADLKPSTLWLAVTLSAAAVLRLWAPGHGIPWAVGGIEASIASRVLAVMRTGDFNPHGFELPGLLFALHLPVGIARYLVGAVRGEWISLAQIDVDQLLPWMRIVTALVGVATVFLVHQVALRWGARHALLSAALLAVMPLHVTESHHASPSVPVAFFVTLTLLASLSATERRSVRLFAAAGAMAGFATATNYGGLLALLMPAMAAWVTFPPKPSRLAYVMAALAAWLLAFLVASPFTLLDLPGFLNGFGDFMARFRAAGEQGGRTWLVDLRHLQQALGWPALVLMFAGIGMGLVRSVRGPGRERWTLLTVFPLVAYAVIAMRGAGEPRSIVPLMPFACVLAALAVISGVSLLRRFSIPRAVRTTLIVALTVAALLPPSIGAGRHARDLRRATPARRAWEWISREVPRGQAVAVERGTLRLPALQYDERPLERAAAWDAADLARRGVRWVVLAVPDPGADPRADVPPPGTREVARFAPAPGRPEPGLRVLVLR
jgi:hypothetical protein